MTSLKFRRVLASLAIAGLCSATLDACTPSSTPFASLASPAAERHLLDRLYFGRSMGGGGTVSNDEWTVFLREVVTPRYPQGFTVFNAYGQWRDQAGRIAREDSFVIELAHLARVEESATVRSIIDAYKQRFRQESVFWTRQVVTLPAPG